MAHIHRDSDPPFDQCQWGYTTAAIDVDSSKETETTASGTWTKKSILRNALYFISKSREKSKIMIHEFCRV